MPLLDHFHPPVIHEVQWNTFHSGWATRIADALNDLVPAEFRVHEHLKLGGGVEIDVASVRTPPGRNGTTSPILSDWQPPSAVAVPAIFPDNFEVLVYRQFGGRHLVAAIELVSPSNKERLTEREAFAAKVASYLHEGVSVLVVDVVTQRRANLHDEIVRLMRMPDELRMSADPPLYASAYRPVIRDGAPQFDIWTRQFNVGDALPTMPLRLIADYFVPVELEATYMEACRRREAHRVTDVLTLDPANPAGVAPAVFRRVWRTALDQPGFALLGFTRAVTSHELRRAMVELVAEFPVKFVPERFGRFDQQVSSRFHRDGAPPASLLVLGYEPTVVRSRFWVADASAAAHTAGLELKAYLAAHNPMFPAGEAALEPFITELPLPNNSFVIVANNSLLPLGGGNPLGVLHKAVIPSPDPTGRRVINSVGFTPADGTSGLPQEETTRFLTRDDLD